MFQFSSHDRYSKKEFRKCHGQKNNLLHFFLREKWSSLLFVDMPSKYFFTNFVFYELALLKNSYLQLTACAEIVFFKCTAMTFPTAKSAFPVILEIFWTVFVQASQFRSSPYRYTETILVAVFENGPEYCERAI